MHLAGHVEALSEESGVGSGLLSLSHSLSLNTGGGARGHLDPLLDMILVVGDQAADESVINGLGTVEVGEEKPDEEGEADPVPVGNEVEDEAEEGL